MFDVYSICLLVESNLRTMSNCFQKYLHLITRLVYLLERLFLLYYWCCVEIIDCGEKMSEISSYVSLEKLVDIVNTTRRYSDVR